MAARLVAGGVELGQPVDGAGRALAVGATGRWGRRAQPQAAPPLLLCLHMSTHFAASRHTHLPCHIQEASQYQERSRALKFPTCSNFGQRLAASQGLMPGLLSADRTQSALPAYCRIKGALAIKGTPVVGLIEAKQLGRTRWDGTCRRCQGRSTSPTALPA